MKSTDVESPIWDGPLSHRSPGRTGRGAVPGVGCQRWPVTPLSNSRRLSNRKSVVMAPTHVEMYTSHDEAK